MSRVYDHRPLGAGSSSGPPGAPSQGQQPQQPPSGVSAPVGVASPASAAAAAAQAAMSQQQGPQQLPMSVQQQQQQQQQQHQGPPGPPPQQQQQQGPPPPGPGPPGAAQMNASVARLTDLLEFVKAEFDQVITESSVLKMQREEYETIISHHAAELNGMRIMSFELERKHLEEKRLMQDEIARLQDELHKMRRDSGTSATAAQQAISPTGAPANTLSNRPTSSNGASRLPPILGNRPSSSSSLPSHGFPHARQQSHEYENGRDELSHAHSNKRARTSEDDSSKHKSKHRSSAGSKALSPVPGSGSPAGGPRPRSAQAFSPRSSVRPATPNEAAGPTAAKPELSPRSLAPNGASAPAAAPVTAPASRQNSVQPPADMFDPENVARDLKKEGSDWMTVFNPNVKRVLDVGLVHTLVHDSVVCCVKFSPDGKALATGCNKNTTLYDTKTGAKMTVLADDSDPDSSDNYIRSTSFSADGKLLATGSEDKTIRIWNIAQRRIIKSLKGHNSEIYSLAFSPDGKRLVSGSGDCTAMIWDIESGTCVYRLENDDKYGSTAEGGSADAGVTSVVLSPDGALLAAGSLDTIVRLWDARTGELIERLSGHKNSVYSVAFSPDGKFLVSASLDKTLKMWDVQPFRQAIETSNGASYRPSAPGESKVACTTTLQGHKDYVLSVAVSPDGQWIVSGSKDRGVQFWDPATAKAQFMLQGHKNSVISVAVSDAGGLVATGSGDWSARIWSYERLA